MNPRLAIGAVIFWFAPGIACLTAAASGPQEIVAQRAIAQPADAVPSMQNRAIGVQLEVSPQGVNRLIVTDRLDGTHVILSDPFSILLKDGRVYDAKDLTPVGGVAKHRIAPRPDTARAADRLPGEELELQLVSGDGAIQVQWSIVLLEGANYVRQRLSITAGSSDVPISRVQLIDLKWKGAVVSGSVEGSPIVAGDIFLGFEDPLSKSKVTNGRATAWVERELPLRAGTSIAYSSVIGVARPGQMRRDFLAYVEQERAHPYRTFLHYNSWYDLGYFTPYDQAGVLDRVQAFGRELTEKRGVKLDSFLFDDGWDDRKSLWKFNADFPQGFAPVRQAAEKYGADPGVWMSPWGGYSKPKQERIAFGKAAGYETVGNGYALSGPVYYAAFRDVCLEMVRKYGVNQFKFDGTGNADSVFQGSSFDSDFAAAIHLIAELRAEKPDLFINLTTGTWPSPFWLLHADSIWRGGEDDGFAGVGSDRERWITYRDADTYQRIVQNGPLFPLNSLMLHGMIYARFRKKLDSDPGNDFRNEIRSYFGTGTQLQEMYITPGLLSRANWDDLAEAAKWSRANAGVLKDTHWVGGDPAWLEVYGWASWTPEKGILVLRNPGDRKQTIRLKLKDVFELPPGAARRYAAKSPWQEDAGRSALAVGAEQTRSCPAWRLMISETWCAP
jgi:hypothetical protein